MGNNMTDVDLAGREDLFHGISSLEKTTQGVVPLRMTAKLLDFYRRASDAWFIRARCSAGVRLKFRTAAGKLAMKVGFGPFCRDFFGFDVSCAGNLVRHFTQDHSGESFAFETALPGRGPRVVTVAFPWQTECTITAFQLDDASLVEPVAYPRQPMVFIGDSITQGFVVSSPGDSYAARTARCLGRDSVNLAVGGMVMLGEAVEGALAYDWDTAVLAYGVNDCSKHRELKDFRADSMRSLQALCSRAGAKVFVIAPLPWPGCPAEHPAELALPRYREILAECVANFPQATLINGLELLENDPQYFADGVHPNREGMERIARRLIPRLRDGGAR